MLEKERVLSKRAPYEKALENPAAYFGSPESVVETAELSKEEKIEVLRRWEYDARELDAEEEESPAGHSDENLLQRIHRALQMLGASIDLEAAPPTKIGGIPRGAVREEKIAVATLDADTLAAMSEALDDEYKARATYQAVISAFGEIRPFINIVEAEQRHAEALLALYRRFGATPPEDQWAGEVEPPESIAKACSDAIEGEIENARMYERLLGQVRNSAVREVLLRLQAASQDNHLPAFQRCLERETGGRGEGPRRRRFRRRGRQ
jgi:rubrerythrin